MLNYKLIYDQIISFLADYELYILKSNGKFSQSIKIPISALRSFKFVLHNEQNRAYLFEVFEDVNGEEIRILSVSIEKADDVIKIKEILKIFFRDTEQTIEKLEHKNPDFARLEKNPIN